MATPKPDPPEAAFPDDATSTKDPSRAVGRAMAPLAPGAMLAGRFRIVALLGRGGMGEVYRAEDLKLAQPVALKFLPEPIDEARLRRFYGEVRLGRQVAHPNVCRIYDLSEAEGRHFLVMEYVDGEDLASLLRRIGRLPAEKALDLARGICAGLAASHEKGVLHRDLKPANVMVDGRGHPRITDFGLAAEAGEGGGELAGTPAYMAPEQLGGQPATVLSDLYALGLLLYEMFTGRRRFEASTLEELVERHREAAPPSLSDVRDVSPAVERVIVRCLDENPAGRPPSARAVLGALPGGDPLQAAIDAGETPSPAMVAAAGAVGDLSAPRAWAGLAALFAGLALATVAAGHFLLLRRVPLPKSPEVLAERAREVAARFGYRERAGDSAVGFEVDQRRIEEIAADPSPRRWDALASSRPAPLVFYYRQSPGPLAAWSPEKRVLKRDPPFDVPGMVEVTLDPDGRLVEFAAVPPPVAAPAGAADWGAPFAEAGLDLSAFAPAAADRSAPVDSDEKAAWESQGPERLRVDAAGRRGRVVWWRLSGPWARPPAEVAPRAGVAEIVFFAMILLMQLGGVLLAMRNLRAGRGDRRGAFRLAGFVFAAQFAAGLLRTDHVAQLWDEFDAVVTLVARALWWAAFVWVVYLAVEPHVRRRWPRMLISWTRLVDGRWRDPMVGRDVLLGATGGVWLALVLFGLALLLPAWLGLGAARPRADIVSPLAGIRHMLFFLASNMPVSVLQALTVPILVLVLRIVFRSDLAALVGLGVFACAYNYIQLSKFSSGPAAVAISVVASVLLVLLVTRATLLALAAGVYFIHVLEAAPLTLDLDAWYADRSVLAVGLLAAVAIAAFVVSLGGKPPFPSAED